MGKRSAMGSFSSALLDMILMYLAPGCLLETELNIAIRFVQHRARLGCHQLKATTTHNSSVRSAYIEGFVSLWRGLLFSDLRGV